MPHAGSLHADAIASMKAREAERAPHPVDAAGILKHGLGNERDAVRVAGKKHGFRIVARRGLQMRRHPNPQNRDPGGIIAQ
jgi:hypothetical protein